MLIYFCMRDACKYTLDTANGRILRFRLDSGQIWERGGENEEELFKEYDGQRRWWASISAQWGKNEASIS